MFQLAIFNTLKEKLRMTEIELKWALLTDIQAHHNLFYQSVDINTNSLRCPTKEEKVERLTSLLQYHTKSVATGVLLNKIDNKK